MKKGIDVSSHQGTINWAKTNVDFAIIRCGYGDNIERQDDTQFVNNVNGCISNGIPFGIYLYSYAKNLTGNESIQSEIDHVLRLVNGKKPFCIYIDMEDDSTISLGANKLQSFAEYFCSKITEAGYKAGVYANQYWFNTYINPLSLEQKGYSVWCAKYSNEEPKIKSKYDIWQYSSIGSVNGINGNVDMNYMYNDITNLNPSTPSNTQTNTEVNVYYRVKTQKYGWLSEVKNLEDYAGWEDSPITDIAIKVDKGSIKYRVHIKGGQWLPYVNGYNINDSKNGYAGNGKVIDAIEVYYYTPDNIRPYKKAKYKINNYSWQYDNETKNSPEGKKQDGYAGMFGVNATKFQIIIV